MSLFSKVLWFKNRSGVFHSEKCGREIQYESGLELDFIKYLEGSKEVLFYWEQPIVISYWRASSKLGPLKKRQSKKSDPAPLMGRISINGTMTQFSCRLTVRSSLWDAKANKAVGKSLEAQHVNEKQENIKTNIGKQYQRLYDRDSYVTAEKVRNAFLGMGDDCRLLSQTFDGYLTRFQKRVGKDRNISTFKNYNKVSHYLATFLKYNIR